MKHTLVAAAAIILPALHAPAAAQQWPQRPVRMVIGFPPGGGIDVVARLLGVKLGDSLGQQFVVDNRPGASGIVGTEIVAKAAPDGHTFFVGTTGNLSVNALLLKNLPFNIERDFTPVMQISSVPFLIYAHPKVPAKSFDELIAHIKANPGKVN
jgi:tripartite-type tricarboxylate transporter receptor subunit TctC